MYQKDYILRMIEMLGDLIAGILGLIKKGEFEHAEEKLENLYNKMLKEDSAFFRDIPENDLTDRLLHQHNYTNGHLEVLAELFNAEAELCLAQGNKPGSLEYSHRSLRLFEFIDAEYRVFSRERIYKMEAIRERIRTLETV
ncbi:MAG: hypothetical protein ABSF81_06085 [Bacteroidales bacterium]